MSSTEKGRVSPDVREPATSGADETRTPDGTLSFSSPVGATLLVLYAWYATAAFFGPFSPAADDAGELLLAGLLVLALSVVHEIGHAVAGLLVGVSFRSLTIGPLAFVRGGRGYRLRPNSHWLRFSGCVERDFTSGRPDNLRLIASALGGPGANLLLAAAVFATAPRGGLAEDFALWSLLFGLFNLLPIRHGGQTSDGGLVLALWRSRNTHR